MSENTVSVTLQKMIRESLGYYEYKNEDEKQIFAVLQLFLKEEASILDNLSASQLEMAYTKLVTIIPSRGFCNEEEHEIYQDFMIFLNHIIGVKNHTLAIEGFMKRLRRGEVTKHSLS